LSGSWLRCLEICGENPAVAKIEVRLDRQSSLPRKAATAGEFAERLNGRGGEGDGLLVDGEDDAAVLAADAVAGAGGMDAEAAGGDRAELVVLGALEDEDLLVAGVEMERDAAAGGEAEEGGGGACYPIAVETVDLDAFVESLPWDVRLPVLRPGKIKAVQDVLHCGWVGGNTGHEGVTVSSPGWDCTAEKRYPMAEINCSDVATAPKTPPCILIILMAAR